MIDMPEWKAAMMDADDVGCLNERPLKIPIHIRAQLAIANPAARGVYPGSGPRVGGQTGSCRESLNVSNLQQNDRGEDEPHPRQRPQKLQLPARTEAFLHPALKPLDLVLHRVQLLQESLRGEATVRRQKGEFLLQLLLAPLAEGIAGPLR